ncbi:MAG: hypothetical protein FJY82_14665 [Candidatus Aminicenantes bacterium]|nr:hypothetical protein [Candidatus Aminicenantes bacterium]
MSSATAVKRALALFGAAALLGGALRAQTDDWREEAAQALSKKTYGSLLENLGGRYAGLEAGQKADAAGILAYCAGKMGDETAETRWLVDYFDVQNAKDSGLVFLDFSIQTEVLGYLNDWKQRFPWVTSIALVKGVGDDVIIPQGVLPLVVEIQNRAYYKFAEGPEVVKGGEFLPGFNIIGLDANLLFSHSGRRIYFLELKSGPLILKKQIDLDVHVDWPAPPAAEEPPIPREVPVGTVPPKQVREYQLTMYVGGDLVMTSTKTETIQPLYLGLPPSNNPAFLKPDYYTKRGDSWLSPNFNTFSIFDAIGLLYKALKDLWGKRKGQNVEPPKVQTVQDLSLKFWTRNASGYESELKVELNLWTTNLPYVFKPGTCP